MKIMKSISPQFKTNQKHQKQIVFENSYINQKTNKRHLEYTKKYGRIPTEGCEIVQKNNSDFNKCNQLQITNCTQNKIKKDFSVGNFFIINPNQPKKQNLQKEMYQQNMHLTVKNNHEQKTFNEGIYYHKKDPLNIKHDRTSHKLFHNRASFKFNGETLNNKSYLEKKSIANFKNPNNFYQNRNTELDCNNNITQMERKIQFRHTYLNPDCELQDREWPKATQKRKSNKENAQNGPKHNEKISIKKQKVKKQMNNFNFTSTEGYESSKNTRIHTQANEDNFQLKITKQIIGNPINDKSKEVLQSIQNQEKHSKKKKQIQSGWLKKKYGQAQIKTQPCEIVSKERSSKIVDWKNILIFKQKIGQGTFGKVYVAKRKDTGEVCAVKKVLVDKKYKSRQLQIATSLDSKFVMKVYGVFTTFQKKQEYLNIVMQYYPENLYERINSQSKPKVVALQQKILIYQMLKGLSYIHSRSICHRDIKPHNMLVQNWKLVLCDFGSAKVLVKGQSNLSYICSRCYRAPQLIFGSTQYTTQIDMWALGCVILEMINKIPLFIGQNSLDHLLEVIKILGTPTRQQVLEMNPNYDISDYQMPFIKRKSLTKLFPQSDINLIDLVNKLLVYSPKERLSAIEALGHKYFDEIRQKQTFEKMRKYLPIQNALAMSAIESDFFNFDQKQLKMKKNSKTQLVPFWYKK